MIYIGVLILLIALLKLPYFKGLIGENKVNTVLSTLSKDYIIYHDLYIPKRDGTTSQIDHLVVSPFGLFVIETKNYRGNIRGSDSDKFWVQSFKRTRNQFYNPIWQNKGHIKAVKEYLNISNPIFKGLVVFSNKSHLRLLSENNVIYIKNLVNTILKFETVLVSEKQRNYICSRLNTLNRDHFVKQAHIKHLKSIY